MARAAVGALEITLVALEALAHRRRTNRPLRLVDHARVTGDARAVDWGEREVFLVWKDDSLDAIGLRAREPKRSIHQRHTVFVAGLTRLDPWWGFVSRTLHLAMTFRTAQALGLARTTALDVEMLQVFEAGNLALAAGRADKRKEH
jgi:hypothetical protein